MTHFTHRSRVRAGHPTATGPVAPTCSWDRWGRAEAQRTALGEALVMRRRTRVRFPPPPPLSAGESRHLVGEEGRRPLLTAVVAGPPHLARKSGQRADAPVPRSLCPVVRLGCGTGSAAAAVVLGTSA